MGRVFIGIGSNQGDRLALISQAVRAISAAGGMRMVQMATIRETEPIGPPQEPYLNTVVEVETDQAPEELLKTLQGIERQLGRSPSPQRWGPRVIDLDLLLYDDRVVQRPGLSIPHPRMHERVFVLEPLAQLAPELVHPVLRQSVAALREQLALKHPGLAACPPRS